MLYSTAISVLTLADRRLNKEDVLGQDICAVVTLSPDVEDCRRRDA